jgi:putative nucleotidyltransferase with HDIG domain
VNLLTLQYAQQLLAEAEQLNPGPWVQHSIYTAQAAERIAAHLPGVDPEQAHIFGLLHDIGRRYGPSDMRHVLDGYRFLSDLGFEGAARICLTHSFPIQDANCGAGKWDCTLEEVALVQTALAGMAYTDSDRLLQLCDCLALPSGFCLVEKRLVDVALRYGVNEYTLPRWKGYLHLLEEFSAAVGGSVYDLLPGVVENTFGNKATNLR